VPPKVRLVHFLSLAVAAIVLVYDSTTQWFQLDEWDFLAHRGVRLTGDDGLFYPHNVHWSTIPILIWRGLFNLVGVRDYWLYSLPLIAASLVVAHVLWRLMLRYQVEPWTATALVGTFVVLGVGSQNLIWAFQIGFVGSLAFGLLAVEATENNRPWLAASLGFGAILCSGMGVPLVAAYGAVALARRKFRVAVIAVVPPAAIFLAWWFGIGHRAGAHAVHITVGGLASYVWTGLAASVGGYLDLPRFVGGVLVVALAAACIWRRDVPAVLAFMTVPFYAFVGIGRVGLFGATEAAESRYSYFAIALLLPLIGQLATSLIRIRGLAPVVITILVILIGLNLVILQTDSSTRARYGTVLHNDVDATAYLLSHGEPLSGTALPTRVWEGAQSTITVTTLEDLIKRGQYPVPATVNTVALKNARTLLEIFASPRRAYSAGATFVDTDLPICVRLHKGSSVKIRLGVTNSLRVVPAYSTRFSASSPIVMQVTLLSSHVVYGAATDVLMDSSDRWLNIPGGGYQTATLMPTNDTTLICQA
jgi:hypothetical protein